ncbi:MAG TPA: flavodoxin [Planctomycetaceae bacterium]|nr:flavodoxin [Planctomycetaceae bacterium]
MELSMAIFYGSSTGNTEMAAEKIRDQMGAFVSHMADVSKADPADMENYDLLFLGVSTWNIGEMQDDWADFIPRMEGLNLAGKKIAMFAMGDAVGYPYNFLDAMGELWGVVKDLGNPELVGIWPLEEYEFEDSQGKYDESHFLGLGLDEDNESELTDDRIKAWLLKVMQDLGLLQTA